jgi:hypothetical protein
MKHFVVVYERPTTSLQLIREFGGDDWASAHALRNELELKYRLEPETEIVLLWADSLEGLRSTHSRYFVNVVDPDAPASLRVT